MHFSGFLLGFVLLTIVDANWAQFELEEYKNVNKVLFWLPTFL